MAAVRARCSSPRGGSLPDEVTDTLWGGQVWDEPLQLPAQQTTTEWTR
jgi:hypothetical protein